MSMGVDEGLNIPDSSEVSARAKRLLELEQLRKVEPLSERCKTVYVVVIPPFPPLTFETHNF